MCRSTCSRCARPPHAPCGSPARRASCRASRGCAMQKLCRNRAFALESWFRRSTQWAFFQNDNALKQRLFWNNRAKRRCGLSHGASDADRFAQMYGTIVPANIPESTAWWKRQTLELAAITDDAEAGLMQIMVTITQNNRNPEMLAAVRLARFFLRVVAETEAAPRRPACLRRMENPQFSTSNRAQL